MSDHHGNENIKPKDQIIDELT